MFLSAGRETLDLSRDYSVRLIEDYAEFGTMKEPWNRLAESYGIYTPWLTHEWFDLCIKYSLPGKKILIVVVARAGQVVAIAPFAWERERIKGLIEVRKLQLLGSTPSPVRSFILGKSTREETEQVLRAVILFSRAFRKNWDLIAMEKIPEESCFFQGLLETIPKLGLRYCLSSSAGNWFLDGIDYSFSQYFASLPKKIRKDVEYCQRRLDKMGNLSLTVESNGGSLEDWLDVYDRIRGRSWKAPEKDREFIREATRIFAAKGWLRLGTLNHDGIPIACQKWVVCGGKAYIWDVIHDEAYGKFSPGKILSAAMSRQVLDRDRVTEIDFMTGDEPYKKDWTPRRRERKALLIFNKTARGGLLSFLARKVLPLIKKNREALSLWTRLGLRGNGSGAKEVQVKPDGLD